ncbi:MAG TPA: DUF1501 domain-containing protein [Gemmataceae bacterium]|nr:DUF1501 domain-containing protein [Gemmataceae bacterium]
MSASLAFRVPRSAFRAGLSRRDWLRLSAAGIAGCSMSGWLGTLADAAAADPKRRRSCILLWMNGGPSQMDTFDLKPGSTNGGPFREISTAVSGIKISEHLPRIARHMDRLALVRSMSSKEGDHGLASYYVHAGYAQRGPIQYPTLGALVAKEAGARDADLPAFVSIAPFRMLNGAAHSPGFLGPRFAPLNVGDAGQRYPAPADGDTGAKTLRVQNLTPHAGVGAEHFEARLRLVQQMQHDFLADHPSAAAKNHQTAYERATRLMRTAAAKALDLDQEPAKLRDAYGRNKFGQGCLLARRLVERGVPFIEVSLGGDNGIGWDTHSNNFEKVHELSQALDAGWATLVDDLKARGLLDSTLIVWMGEFGRTPIINGDKGRDHFPNAWTAVLGGGGIKGGQVIGKTSANGEGIEQRPVSVPDLLATVCLALGIDATQLNQSNVGRPISLVDKAGRALKDIVASR